MYGFDIVGGIPRVETEEFPSGIASGMPPPPPGGLPPVPAQFPGPDLSRVSTPPPVPPAVFEDEGGFPAVPPPPGPPPAGGLPKLPASSVSLSPRVSRGLPSPSNGGRSSGGLPRFGFGAMPVSPPASGTHTPVLEQKRSDPYRGGAEYARSSAVTDQPGVPSHRSQFSGIGLSGFANIISNPADDMRGAETELKFQSVLDQATTGLLMVESMKEVFRKFGKHQKADADKLMDVYERMPQRFVGTDGMEDLADLCDMAHRLILETVNAQKAFADFVAGTLVPTMTKYLQEREGRLQWIRKNHQQTEQKYDSAVTNMKKSQTAAIHASERAKALDPMKSGVRSSSPAEPQPKKRGLFRGLRKKEVDAEEVYQQATASAENYKAAVMTANHEQQQYVRTISKLKLNCIQLEKERIDELTKFVNRYLARHCQFFNNDRVTTLQTQILSKIEVTDSHTQLEEYVQRTVQREGVWRVPSKHQFDLPSFRNIFHSLEDALNVTLKNDPTARIPTIMTTLMNKVIENNGFQTEGIFRISAQQSHLDSLRRELANGNYVLTTPDPHVPAAMLKDWLRGLSDSLIPGLFYDGCIEMAKSGRANPESLGVFVSQLPEVNRECLRYLVHFLGQLIVPANQSYTRMNLENVAIVFAPTVLRCPHDDPQIMMLNSRYEKDFIELLIEMLPTGY